jgi:hypothetical protein
MVLGIKVPRLGWRQRGPQNWTGYSLSRQCESHKNLHISLSSVGHSERTRSVSAWGNRDTERTISCLGVLRRSSTWLSRARGFAVKVLGYWKNTERQHQLKDPHRGDLKGCAGHNTATGPSCSSGVSNFLLVASTELSPHPLLLLASCIPYFPFSIYF